MPDDKKSDDKGGTALDRLLKGLDAMSAKIDKMGSRMDSIEAAQTKRADADPPPPPPPGDKKPEPAEGAEPPPIAADKPAAKDAEPPPPPPPPPAPPPPAKDALPPEFLKGKEEGDKKEEKEEKEAADSVGDLNMLRKRLAKLEASMGTRTEHDLAADQAAADSVYSLYGESAPRPLIGDTRGSYILRNLEKFKVHSPAWKDIDLTPLSVDEKVLDIAASQIYAAARDAASSPASVPEGTLRAVTHRTPTGHIETRFMGSPSAWMNRHAPNRRFVTAINLKKD